MSKFVHSAEHIRRFCLNFPEASEVTQFGHPFFKWRAKPLSVLSGEAEEVFSVKVEKEVQPIFLLTLVSQKLHM